MQNIQCGIKFFTFSMPIAVNEPDSYPDITTRSLEYYDKIKLHNLKCLCEIER